jgi:hypothetical protein
MAGMTRDDFKAFGIRHFTPEEVIATGATLQDVKPRLLQHLDHFRIELGQPVHLVRNGLTSGSHSSTYHRQGLAADCTTKPVEPQSVLKAALEADFTAVGIYWNRGHWTSFHLDLRPQRAFWMGYKKPHARKWTYRSLLVTAEDMALLA